MCAMAASPSRFFALYRKFFSLGEIEAPLQR
jgi:hypothetical protein